MIKTKVVQFSLETYPEVNKVIILGDGKVYSLLSTNFLGSIIDSKLNFHEHFAVSKKLNRVFSCFVGYHYFVANIFFWQLTMTDCSLYFNIWSTYIGSWILGQEKISQFMTLNFDIFQKIITKYVLQKSSSCRGICRESGYYISMYLHISMFDILFLIYMLMFDNNIKIRFTRENSPEFSN